MHIALERIGQAAVVLFSGRLDSYSAARIEAELVAAIEAGARKLVFDLAALDYISSAGLRVILVVAKRLKPLGGRLVLCRLSAPVLEVFEISGFLSIMAIHDTKEAALAALD